MIEIEVWRIGNSEPAPKFNIVERPNDWAKAMKNVSITNTQSRQMQFWQYFVDHLESDSNFAHTFRKRKAHPQNWYDLSIGSSEIEKIVTTFQNREAVDDFSVAVSYNDIKEKGYSLSAGQYFDIKIDYVDITEEEFNKRMNNYRSTLKAQFEESHRLEEDILKQLDSIGFNANVGKDNSNE